MAIAKTTDPLIEGERLIQVRLYLLCNVFLARCVDKEESRTVIIALA